MERSETCAILHAVFALILFARAICYYAFCSLGASVGVALFFFFCLVVCVFMGTRDRTSKKLDHGGEHDNPMQRGLL
jgi:hypothetical protein